MKTQTTNPDLKQSNDLRFTTTKIVGKESIIVKIRLNDECKNGHQDFSITGDIYEAGKPKADRYHIAGGCIHEEILKAFPEFKVFVSLHLADADGIPMYAVENGFYHLRNGFNRTKPEESNFKAEFCDYYRISPEQFDGLNESKNQLQYALKLQSLGILNQWQEEAKQAIELLENLTGQKFVNDSKKSQYHEPTIEEVQEEQQRINTGYYTPEAEAQREEVKKNEQFTKLQAERQKELYKINLEYDVKNEVLKVGGKKALENIIFYNHTKTLAFNWRGYDRLSDEVVNNIISQLQLPEGVTIENKKGNSLR